MKRTIEQWRNAVPELMATAQSEAARTYAFADARADILELHREIERLRGIIMALQGEQTAAPSHNETTRTTISDVLDRAGPMESKNWLLDELVAALAKDNKK